jgi:uncharacterized protein YbjT (DUF2867 family)
MAPAEAIFNDAELVLVTGGTGLVGSAIIEKLVERGRKVLR